MATRKIYGLAVRELRKKAGLTQREIADVAGVTPSSISRIERGKRRAAPETAVGIADALAAELEDISFPTLPTADGTELGESA